jgi:GT2 family glycosyltransferase/Tfp pilus assembly protein PilF
MRCSVVIPCHNGADLTRRCIASLLAQDAVRPDEIVLVDNASSDDTGALAGLHASVRVLRQPDNLGFAAGVNAGIRASHGELVLVLNNDTQAAANLLPELVRVLESSPGIGAVAPVSNHVKGPARLPVGDLGRTAAGRAAIASALLAEPGPIHDVDNLAGLCLLVRRTTLDRVGSFDERFGHGNFEDDDLCLRLRLHGYRLTIARRAFLHHEGHATFRALGLDLASEIGRRREQFCGKWRHDPAGRATIAAWHGDLGGAAQAAAAAIAVWPLWPDADWHLARWHLAGGDLARGADHLRRLLQACPRHSEAAALLGTTLLALGETQAAQRHCRYTLRDCHLTTPLQAQLLRDLGQLDYRGNRPAPALAHFQAALELLPSDGDLLNWIGVCQLALGDLAAAAASLQAAADAGFALAQTNLGICLHRLGRPAEAHRCLERAVQLLPDDTTARHNLTVLRAASAPPTLSTPVA